MGTTDPSLDRAEITLDLSRPLGVALESLAGEHIDWINRHLADSEASPITAVHESRKSLRRLRAYFRLIRTELSDETFRCVNLLLRNTGRELSAARSAAVAVDTAVGLAGRVGIEESDPALQDLRTRLVRRREALQVEALHDGLRASLPRVLTEVRATWSLVAGEIEDDFEALRPNLRRVYARGKRGAETAAAAGSTEAYHLWRKRVRYLRFQLEALTPLDPEKVGSQAALVEELAELLGEEHDLAEFSELMAGEAPYLPIARHLVSAAYERQEALQAMADALGSRVYRHSPSRFITELSEVWERFRTGAST